jgi:hypothetical protein
MNRLETRQPHSFNDFPSRTLKVLLKGPRQCVVAIIQHVVRDIWGVKEILENQINGVGIPGNTVEPDSRSRKHTRFRTQRSGQQVPEPVLIEWCAVHLSGLKVIVQFLPM